MMKKTYAFAEFLASKLAVFVDVEEEDLLAPSKWVRMNVDIDINKPSLKGMWIKVEGEVMWIKLKYIKFPEFSYACGLLGHVYRGCSLYKEDVPETNL